LAGSQLEVDILWASGDERLLNIASGTCACCARIDCVSSAGQGSYYVVASKEKTMKSPAALFDGGASEYGRCG
jgi:streptolysin S family bacteriocin protoxin